MQRWKLFLPIFLTLVTAISVLIWDIGGQSNDRYRRHRVSETERAIAVARERVRTEVKDLGAELARVIGSELLDLNPEATLRSKLFLAIGLLKRNDTDQWELEWSRHRDPSLPRQEVVRHVGQLPIDVSKEGGLNVARIANSDGKVHLAVIVPLNIKSGEVMRRQVAVGYVPIYHFMELATPYKGLEEEFLLVDGHGVAVAHADQQYIGAKFDKYPVVEELMARLKAGDAVAGTVEHDTYVGSYDRVPETNLYVATKFPLSDAKSWFVAVGVRGLVIVLATGILCWLAIVWLVRRDSEDMRVMKDTVERLQSPDKSPAEIVKDMDDAHKVFADLARPITLFVKSPAHAALGYLQVAKGKFSDKASRDIVEKIEGECRKIGDFADGLSQELKLPEQDIEACDLTIVIEQALSVFRPSWTSAGIAVEENLRADLRVKADFNGLKSIFKTLLAFSGQELAKNEGQRRITLSTQKMGGVADATIEVMGAGLDREVRRNLFVPFKTRVEGSPMAGLELALVRLTADGFGGDVSIESLGEKGFRFHIRTPTAIAKEEITAGEITVSQELEIPFPAVPEVPTPSQPPPEPVTEPSLDLESFADEEEFEVKVRKPKVRMDT